MNKLYHQFILIVIFVMCLIPVSLSQEKPRESNIPTHNVDNSGRVKIQDRVQSFIMMKLVEYLDLDEEQSAKLFPMIRESNKIRGKLIKERMELIHRIGKEIDDESISIKDLRKQIKEIERIDEQLVKGHKDFLNKSEKILDERQYIKLILFDDRLKEDLFQRFRSRNPRGENDKK